jgi:hypothetical protein
MVEQLRLNAPLLTRIPPCCYAFEFLFDDSFMDVVVVCWSSYCELISLGPSTFPVDILAPA